MAKILIVGGAGYIGGYLTDILRKDDMDVTVYDNLLYESRYLKPGSFIRGDVREREKLKDVLKDYETVVWLAAIVGDGACAVNKGITKDVNEESVKWLCENYKGKIIFTSTCSVYGANNDLLDENSPTNPLSVYAETKLAAEKEILAKSDKPLAFRLGTLYGVGDPFSRIRLDLVANALAYRATSGLPLKVFGGEQWRPLLHVRDVAWAIYYGIKNNISGLYNLGQGNFTIADIARQIQNFIPGTVVEYQDIAFEDKRNYKVDCSKYTDLGWKPLNSLKFGIEQIYGLIKEQRIVNLTDPIYSNAHYLKLENDNATYK